jgi:hypothetical protein
MNALSYLIVCRIGENLMKKRVQFGRVVLLVISCFISNQEHNIIKFEL